MADILLDYGEIMKRDKEQELEDEYRRRVESEENIVNDEGDRIIPRHFAIKSKHNNNYLQYRRYKEFDDESFDGLVQFTGERLVSPYTKFEAEYNSASTYVHIRCCYNNKYLVRHNKHATYIVAAASEPVNDESNWRCTLFEPTYDEKNKTYRFRHVQLDDSIYIHDLSPKMSDCVDAHGSNENKDSEIYLFEIIDWDTIFILPRHVAFKGNNGCYLKFIDPKLQFSGYGIKDPLVANEIFATKDGNIHIKNDASGKFWIRDPDWIHAQSSHPDSNDPNTLFWPVKVNDNTLALRNLGNRAYCKRLTIDGKTDCLNAAVFNVTSEARMEVEEIVVSRSIDRVEYRLKDARIYGQKVVNIVKGDAINKTKETDTVTFKFSYENKKKTNWTATMSAKFGVNVKFEAGIPLVGKSKVDVSFEIEKKHDWGETNKHKDLVEVVNPVTVAPMSRVKIYAVIKQGNCQVPFSYRRTDLLKNGRRVVHVLHDGLFTGVNSYDYEFKSQLVPLETSMDSPTV